MNQFAVIFMVGLFGAMGALARYFIALGMHKWLGDAFPWGTLSVNVTGCFLLGMLAHFGDQYLSPQWKLVLGVGFLGALTTFSTFGLETVARWNGGQAWLAMINIGSNLILGLAAVVAGLWLAGALWPAEKAI